MMKIAFIGLGKMGVPMAGNLAKAGHDVTGFDLVPDTLRRAQEHGVAPSSSPGEAVAGADVIVTMLPAGKHVLGVWGEVIPAAKHGAVIIDSSTIDVDSARKAHELASHAGLNPLDAPVSGGVGGAEAGSLTFMCGGTPAAFEAAKPVLDVMGGRIIHCGEAGAGQVAKLCNNMVLGISMIATSEAMTMGQKLGLDPQTLFDVISTSSGQTWALTHHCPVPGPVPASAANRDFTPGFSAELMVKDLSLAQDAARSAQSAAPMGALAAQLFQIFVAKGYGPKDYAAIIKMLDGSA